MTQFLPFAERWGPWILIAVYAAYKLVTVLSERLMPELVSARREERRLKLKADQEERRIRLETEQQERVERAALYDRFIQQSEATVKLLTAATAAINGMERSLDGNTRAINEMIEIVRRGPSCPLPDCPFMGRKDAEQERPQKP